MKQVDKINAEPEPVMSVPAKLEDMPDVDMVRVAMKAILKGCDAEAIRDAIFDEGLVIGKGRCGEVIEAAKKQIVKCGEKDMGLNFGWAQRNLMEMHKDAVERDDFRARGAIIKQLIELWGLHRPTEEVKEFEVTQDMIDEYEQRLLR